MISDAPLTENALYNQNEELREANRNLEAALLSISHDLRNPLHVIMMDSGKLLEKSGDQFGSRERSSLERVSTAAQHMAGMIDGLLGMCCIAGQNTSFEMVDLSSLASAVFSELHMKEPHRTVVCTVQEGVHGWGDPRLLEVVLVNLIGNSWKYSVNRHSAVIEFGSTASSDGNLTCFIRDNGIGFDASLADRLFLPFQRFHADSEGSGIGLASVQRIITRLGGRVWAEAGKESGAVFYFTLPAVPST
ncbi:MAG: hypothetical protein A2076_02715 [Geobacteraceae bacterium GWC2_53_11]|nr:MAG: hypothetical protein A2076_02715 [Geobacteraceae bacterium GWC2_53_11]